MHTVDLLDRALRAVEGLGYRIREEWLDGRSGDCEIQGQKWLFLDLADSPGEKLCIVASVLSREAARRPLDLDPGLRGLVDARKAA